MSFIVYDLTFLVIFLIFISFFLYRGKKNIRKEGWLLLYKTSWGIKLINYVGKKYKKTLKVLSYVSIFLGYILMVTMLYLFGKIIWVYMFSRDVVRAIKVPPIMPLIPYLPQAFKLDFLPPFYFTYWILIIAIIAVTHEFAHGIFAAREKVKIKNTGFGFFPFFLPVFLAAFVELDEKQMSKKKNFSQMAVLSAGTFANVLTAIFFFIVLFFFFSLAFVPTGVTFDAYASSTVAISTITAINGVAFASPTYENFVNLLNLNETINEIEVDEKKYVGVEGFFKDSEEYVRLYNSAPAINSDLESVIFKINGVSVYDIDGLSNEISKYSAGETITLNVLAEDGEDYNKDIILGAHPDGEGRAWLGIGFYNRESSGVMGRIIGWFSSFKNPNTYYQPKFDGISIFTYQFLWWIILISISVALINMLPVGIFDGGRFFYLTILSLTKSKKTAEKAFKFMTQLILFLVLFLMILWVFKIF